MTTTIKPKTRMKPRSPYRVDDYARATVLGYVVLDLHGDEVAVAATFEQAEWLANRLWLADRFLTVGRRKK